MTNRKRLNNSAGFSVVELGLVIVIILAIVLVGMFVYKRHQNSVSTPAVSSQVTAQPGTVGSINQLVNQEVQSESNAETDASNTAEQSVNNTNNALNAVGGAYNENNF